MGVSQYRRYKRVGNIRDAYVLSWMDKRCLVCGRFITKRSKYYCPVHRSDKYRYIREREYRLTYAHNKWVKEHERSSSIL